MVGVAKVNICRDEQIIGLEAPENGLDLGVDREAGGKTGQLKELGSVLLKLSEILFELLESGVGVKEDHAVAEARFTPLWELLLDLPQECHRLDVHLDCDTLVEEVEGILIEGLETNADEGETCSARPGPTMA